MKPTKPSYVYFFSDYTGLSVNYSGMNPTDHFAWAKVRGDLDHYLTSVLFRFKTRDTHRFDRWVNNIGSLERCWIYNTQTKLFTNPFTKISYDCETFKRICRS